LIQETASVCLIVKDLEKRTKNPDNEMIAQLITGRLRAHGIKHPIEVQKKYKIKKSLLTFYLF
jgi:hypothetical protein